MDYMVNVHIPEVLATGMFTGHKMFRLLTRFDEEKGTTYNVQYYLNNIQDYYSYQELHAPALKDDMLQQFGSKFMTFRTLLEEVTG
jgi:hypothetical protein